MVSPTRTPLTVRDPAFRPATMSRGMSRSMRGTRLPRLSRNGTYSPYGTGLRFTYLSLGPSAVQMIPAFSTVSGVGPSRRAPTRIGAPRSAASASSRALSSSLLRGSESVEFSGQSTTSGASVSPSSIRSTKRCVSSTCSCRIAPRGHCRNSPGVSPCTRAKRDVGPPSPPDRPVGSTDPSSRAPTKPATAIPRC